MISPQYLTPRRQHQLMARCWKKFEGSQVVSKGTFSFVVLWVSPSAIREVLSFKCTLDSQFRGQNENIGHATTTIPVIRSFHNYIFQFMTLNFLLKVPKTTKNQLILKI